MWNLAQADRGRHTCILLDMEDKDSNARIYAWNWFALHAGQRLQLVNFWLVAVSFLAAAFVQARTSHLIAVAIGVSVTGTVASLAFLALDRRTRQLVRVAEDALRHLEQSQTASGQDKVMELVALSNADGRSFFDSYRVIIQGLQLLVSIFFALATIYCLVSL
jgi:hypothetical protein